MSHQNQNAADREQSSVAVDMELRRQLLSCMAETLTRHQYQVFVLNFLEGMPQKEIAAEFDLSRSAVCKTVGAAKRKLRRALGYSFELPAEEEFFYDDLEDS